MARFEALITPVADGQALRAALKQIAQSWVRPSPGWIAATPRWTLFQVVCQ